MATSDRRPPQTFMSVRDKIVVAAFAVAFLAIIGVSYLGSHPLTGSPNASVNATITVYVTNSGLKYHRGSCQYLWQSKIPKSLNDAKRLYDQCSVCKPP